MLERTGGEELGDETYVIPLAHNENGFALAMQRLCIREFLALIRAAKRTFMNAVTKARKPWLICIGICLGYVVTGSC